MQMLMFHHRSRAFREFKTLSPKLTIKSTISNICKHKTYNFNNQELYFQLAFLIPIYFLCFLSQATAKLNFKCRKLRKNSSPCLPAVSYL